MSIRTEQEIWREAFAERDEPSLCRGCNRPIRPDHPAVPVGGHPVLCECGRGVFYDFDHNGVGFWKHDAMPVPGGCWACGRGAVRHV